MTRQTFPWFPVTLERPSLNIMWLGEAAYYDPEYEVVVVDDAYQGRMFDVGAVDVLNANEMRWRGVYDEPYIIRPTRPDDAERWEGSPLRIPLPTEIIGAILTTNMPSPTIAAAVDDQGDVHTIILETAVGLYARYSATWIRMTDISPIEQLDIVTVIPDDLDIYDTADQAGNMVNIASLHPYDKPYQTAIEVTEALVPTVASIAPVATVASVADLPEAVEFANANPDSRWYVERRWKTFGGEATGITLPWKNEGP